MKIDHEKSFSPYLKKNGLSMKRNGHVIQSMIKSHLWKSVLLKFNKLNRNNSDFLLNACTNFNKCRIMLSLEKRDNVLTMLNVGLHGIYNDIN